jgi:LysR family transcriptional activator of nhaA
VLRGAGARGRRSVAIGVADAVPKLVTWRILEPLLTGDGPFHVLCHEGPLEGLLGELAAHRLDLVLSTSAVPADAGFKAFSHLLGESAIGFFAAPALARKLRGNFPQSLHEAPLLLPTDRTANRRMLDAWFEKFGIVPRIVGELDDSALVKTFAQHGIGAFAAPLAVEKEITRQYGVLRIGRIEGLRARFFAISTERKIKHPAISTITQSAREFYSMRAEGEADVAAPATPKRGKGGATLRRTA